jgi:hypothetical protein
MIDVYERDLISATRYLAVTCGVSAPFRCAPVSPSERDHGFGASVASVRRSPKPSGRRAVKRVQDASYDLYSREFSLEDSRGSLQGSRDLASYGQSRRPDSPRPVPPRGRRAFSHLDIASPPEGEEGEASGDLIAGKRVSHAGPIKSALLSSTSHLVDVYLARWRAPTDDRGRVLGRCPRITPQCCFDGSAPLCVN